MKYHQIKGTLPVHTTGMQGNMLCKLKEGFSKSECNALDATEYIPSGGMFRIEFDNELGTDHVRYWFESQLITPRGVQ